MSKRRVPSAHYAPFSIGIAGGFAPPLPSAIYTVTATPQTHELQINAAVRPDGTPVLQNPVSKSLSATDSSTTQLVDELQTILKAIPSGHGDLYRMDTSLLFKSSTLVWTNGHGHNDRRGDEGVRATGEEKVKFQHAIDIVNTLVDKADIVPPSQS